MENTEIKLLLALAKYEKFVPIEFFISDTEACIHERIHARTCIVLNFSSVFHVFTYRYYILFMLEWIICWKY